MKRFLLLGLLVATSLAGCLEDPEDTDAVDTELPVELPPVPVVDPDALLVHLKSFVNEYSERAANLPDHVGARDAIAVHFAEAGLDVWRQEFENGIAQENIAGILWGQDRDNWVVVGAHYDMVTTDCAASLPDPLPDCVLRPRSQGAYDDGSGTLMTMHLASAYAAEAARSGPLPYTIAFVAFDGEERGLQGSGAFAYNLFAEENGGARELAQETPWGNVTVHAMLDLDMFGLNYPAVEAPIYFDNNSPDLVESVKSHAEHIDFPVDQIKFQGITLGRSDYAHFIGHVPTGFFISDFEEWELPADIPVVVPCAPSPAGPVCSAYPFWHIEDTWDTMVLMAGDEQQLKESFDMATQLASGVLHTMATSDDIAMA